jgi:hypothetical protein
MSARDAWAVGYYGTYAKTLIVHWDGRSWTQVPSPSPKAPSDYLLGVAGVSARNVWAVGWYGGKTLIVHWDGRSWTQVPSPSPAEHSQSADDSLYDVTATSPRDAWAVGSTMGHFKTLIVHWNGTSWTRVPSPAPPPYAGGGSTLTGVAAGSPRSAWAIGATGIDPSYKPMIERWTGGAWELKHLRVSGLGPGWVPEDVAAASARSAWVVGYTGSDSPLILHWDGLTWTQTPLPAGSPAPRHAR